jgi:hypothetical protein
MVCMLSSRVIMPISLGSSHRNNFSALTGIFLARIAACEGTFENKQRGSRYQHQSQGQTGLGCKAHSYGCTAALAAAELAGRIHQLRVDPSAKG